LFRRAAAVVHQGGIGTTGQALASGAPQLIVPFSHDQPDNAARVARLGCGHSLLREKYNATRAAHELGALLKASKYFEAARRTAQAMQHEDGIGTACDVIESVFGAAGKLGQPKVPPGVQ
jgi:rhamnosyltransferase subunit B